MVPTAKGVSINIHLLSELKRALEEVEKGNLNLQLAIKKQDEIGSIKARYNNMVKRLDATQEQVKELHLEQLQRADKLVNLGELAAEMAHEVNNPAAIILSRTDYLNIQSQENSHLAKYSEDFQVIMDQIEKVSKITGSILKYSKKLPKKFSAFDLNNTIRESIQFLTPRLEKKQISAHLEFNTEPAIIFGDPQQIEQVIINLVNNAVDAMPEGGKMFISIKNSEHGYIDLSVRDTGYGINSEVQQKIFSPFYTTKAPDKGTGLGLYIVNNICKNHEAIITCTSEPGAGAEFSIRFKRESITK